MKLYFPIPSQPVPTPTLLKHLKTVDSCVDTDYRRNLTIALVANKIRGFSIANESDANGFPGDAVALTSKWIIPKQYYSHITGKHLIEVLRDSYLLVGVTDHLNAFLVMVALINSWDPSTMFYKRW